MATKKTIVLVDGQAPPRFIPSTRFTLALLVFFAFIIQYSQRVNLPIAIVCMVNSTKQTDSRSLSNEPRSSFPYTSTTVKPIINPTQKGGFFDEKQFNWIELQQQILLGGYWAGYIFTQVPGGWLATSIGAKWVYASSLGISSTATLALTIMYLMSNTHFILILILRCIIGIAHGVLFPATIALWSVWAVPQERSTLASIGFCGTHLGTSLTMLIGGICCRYLSSGWMYLFFLTSILGFVWLTLWILFTAASPDLHPTISAHERNYITSLTGNTGKKRAMSLASIPWKKIVTSKPLNALIVTHIANLFGLFFFLTNLGKISNQLFKLQPQLTGYILSFGFFLTLLSSLLSGILTDYIVRSNFITLTNSRKLFNSITSFVPALCMISFCFCDESNQVQGVITILIFLASSGLGYGSGYMVNFADIVPAYSGVIFGIANTFASLAGLIGNIVAGIVVKEPILEQWRKLYIMFGIVYVFGGIVYILFGTAIPRKWAKFQAADNAAKEEEKLNDEEAVPMNEKIQENN
jgi:MFS family permease